MTFREWCMQIAKESTSQVPYEFVRELMICAIRVAYEELLSNPAEADLDIKGIGRFYLNHRICHNNFPTEDKPEYAAHWTLHFRPARFIKDTINGRQDPRLLTVASAYPLYPEYYESINKSYVHGRNSQLYPNYKIKYKVTAIEGYDKLYNQMRREMKKLELAAKEQEEKKKKKNE